MTQGLTQAELDELLQNLQSVRVRPYDFRRPGKFTKDQVRALTMIHEQFGRWITGYFATHLRARVQVGVRSVGQFPYSEVVQGMANPTVAITYRVPPLPGVCLAEMSSNIAMAIVERVFGGPGGDDQPNRPLTDIEKSVILRVFLDLLPGLAEAWRGVVALDPQPINLETNPFFLQMSTPQEIVALVTLAVRMGEHVGHLALAWPYATMEPVLARLSPSHSLAGAVGSAGPGPMRAHLEEAEVQVAVRLGSVRLRVGDFLALRPGDVLVTDQRAGGDVTVYVEGRPAFRGRAGVVGRRLAVEVRQVLGR